MSTTTASSYNSSPTIKRIPSSPGLTGFGSSLSSLSQQQQQGVYGSDDKDNSYANMADAKNDQLPMGGHSMGQPGLGLSQGKGEYRTVGIDDEDSVGLRNAVGKGGAGLLNVPEAAQHPALPIASYCFSSILMTVVNKFVLSGQHFTMNFLLLTIQSVVCVSCVVVCKRAKIITFRDFDKDDARKWFPVSFMLVMVIYTGSKSLQYLTIPVYTIFKNLTIILIAYGEVLWFGGQVSGMTLVSFGLMVLSSIVAAWNDIAKVLLGPTAEQLLPDLVDANKGTGNSTAGYIWMFINCVVSAGYVLGMRKRIKVTNFKDWDSMYYNNLLSIPVLVVFSVIFETWSMDNLRLNFPEETRSVLLFMMAFSGAAAVFISYSTAWCVRTTSSTTYSMVGSLNKLPVAASGLLFFGDPVTFCSVSAILLGFIAGLVYTVAKQAQANAKKANGAIELGSKPR